MSARGVIHAARQDTGGAGFFGILGVRGCVVGQGAALLLGMLVARCGHGGYVMARGSAVMSIVARLSCFCFRYNPETKLFP